MRLTHLKLQYMQEKLYVAQTEIATMMVATLSLELKALSLSLEHPILAAQL